jgi:hypothetical protein
MMPQQDDDVIKARQKSRAIVTAVALGLFVVLVFAVSIAKIRLGFNG